MDAKKIVMYVAIVIAVYIVLRLVFDNTSKSTLVRLHNAKVETTIPANKLPKSPANDFAYSIWIYVEDWNYKYGEEKIIFRRMITGGKNSPMVSFDANKNNLKVHVETYSGGGQGGESKDCIVDNIPLQKWTHLVVTTYNNTIDTYLDGKLVKSCLLQGVPNVKADSPLMLTPKNGTGGDKDLPGFGGYVRQFQYFSKTLNPREVYEIYKLGPKGGFDLGGIFDRYKMKFSFMKDNLEVTGFEI
tara:strand:+ start:279 stop:1010 length:732 start_codon:yes stop_codon:yes gene_type:complete